MERVYTLSEILGYKSNFSFIDDSGNIVLMGECYYTVNRDLLITITIAGKGKPIHGLAYFLEGKDALDFKFNEQQKKKHS